MYAVGVAETQTGHEDTDGEGSKWRRNEEEFTAKRAREGGREKTRGGILIERERKER